MKRIIVTDTITETYTVMVPDDADAEAIEDMFMDGEWKVEADIDRSVHERDWTEWTPEHVRRWGTPVPTSLQAPP